MATIDTRAEIVTASNGREYRYILERKRRWNVGMRKHQNELTGKIILWFTDSAHYVICESWDMVKKHAEAWSQPPAECYSSCEDSNCPYTHPMRGSQQ